MPEYHVRHTHILLRIACIVLFSLLFLVPQAQTANAAGGVPMLVDFENLPVGTPVFNQYVGVTFIGADNSNPDGSHPVTIFKPTAATASPVQALKSNFLLSCEFCGTHLTMRFDLAQTRVRLSTGLAVSGFSPGTMLMQGFASDPSIAGALQVAQSFAPCLGTNPTPITTPLGINDSQGRIRFVELSVVSCTTPTDPNSGADNGTIILDNLLYNRPLHPPPGDHTPPIITITTPTNNSTVVGSAFGATDTPIQATVTENALASLTAQVNGHPAIPVSYYHTTPLTYSAYIEVTDKDGLIDGSNTVVLTAKDFDLPQNTGTASVTFTFHVKPFPPPSKVDVWPTAYEVTQTIDPGPHLLTSYDWSSPGYSVIVPRDPPLIQGKLTLIRIYGAVSGTTTPISNVPAVASVRLANCTSNCDIPGGQGMVPLFPPTSPNTPFSPNTAGLTLPPFGSPGSYPANVATNFRKTWNFWLQPSWTMQDLDVTIDVNFGRYNGFPEQKPVTECTGGTIEECYYNNMVTLHLHFRAVPAMYVDYTVFHVTGTYKNQTYNDVQPTMQQILNIFSMLNKLLPEPVFMGARNDITVDPGINKDDLLDKIDSCSRDNATWGLACAYVNIRIGIFPADQSKPGSHQFAANEYDTSTNTFIAGLAWVGRTGSWADADNPFDAAHELMHNIGFEHWACENGTSDDECGVFPNPHGATEIYGTDVANWTVLPPGDDSSNATPHSHDIMSYGQLCGVQDKSGKYIYGGGPGCDLGEWISWYDYDILLDSHDVGSYDPNDPPALLVTGHISNGVATFQPAYQLNVSHPLTDTITEDDASSIYTMQGYDHNGNVVFVHNFEAVESTVHTPANGKNFFFEEAVPFVPNLQKIEVLKGDQVLGTLVNPAPGQTPTVSITAPTAGTVWQTGKPQTIRWISNSPAGVPLYAMVSYSIDGGQSFYPLGRNLTASSLTINPDELPGSTNAMIYVQVSDGLNTATAKVGPFTVQPKGPSVHIMSPRTNIKVSAQIPITLAGSAYDLQESLTDSQFQWSSDRDGVLGTGQNLTVWKLSVGRHKLTLTVTDSHGRVGQDTIIIEILPVPGSQSSPPFNWLLFLLIALGILLVIVAVIVFILLRRRGGSAATPSTT